ncbi:MAG: response regulator [Lentisphaerae bacterium]|nr:response regulator [Lentisphaerota bacterium]
MAEDDPEDQMLMRDAFRTAYPAAALRMVSDGEELLDYLHQRGPYTDAVMPNLILLDLNMPRRDGREVLHDIKSHPHLHRIPVVVLTTSDSEVDIARSYDLGVNSYIRKPANFARLIDIVHTLRNYWFDVVALPPTA